MVGFISKRAMAQSHWIIDVEQDAEGCFITLPKEFLEVNDWQPGDTIKWIDNKDGSWQLINTKISNTGLMSLKTMV